MEQPDPQDIARAFEFQYQQKLQELQLENAKLQNELAKAKTACRENESIPQEDSQIPTAHPSEAAREKKVYRQALRDIQEENFNEAIVSMETFVKSFPKSQLADHALYWIAQIYLQKNEPDLARAELERLIKLYPNGQRAPRARARLRELKHAAKSPEKLIVAKDFKINVPESSIASGGKP